MAIHCTAIHGCPVLSSRFGRYQTLFAVFGFFDGLVHLFHHRIIRTVCTAMLALVCVEFFLQLNPCNHIRRGIQHVIAGFESEGSVLAYLMDSAGAETKGA